MNNCADLITAKYPNKTVILQLDHTVYIHNNVFQTFHRLYNVKKLIEDSGDFEFGYVEHIVKAALSNISNIGSSTKYSFLDQPDWYQHAEVDVIPNDSVLLEIYVESNVR